MTPPPNQDGARMPEPGMPRHAQGRRSTDIATATSESRPAPAGPSRAELRFRALAQATNQMVWIVSPDGMHDRDTATWQAYTGLTAEQVVGWGWLSAIHPDDRAGIEVAWERAVATRGPFEVEYRLRRADGVYRRMWVQGIPVRDDDGNVLEWVGTCIDITDRVAFEEQTRAQMRELEAIFEAMTDGVFVYDATGHVVRCNRAASALLAIPAQDDYLSLALDERSVLLSPRDEHGRKLLVAPRPISRILQGETLSGSTSLDLTLRRLDGHPLSCTLTGAPIRDGDGTITGAILLVRDLGAHHKIESELAERRQQLDAILTAITDQVYFYNAAGHLLYANAAARTFDTRIADPEYIARPINQRTATMTMLDEQGQPLAPSQTPVARVLRGDVLTMRKALDTWLVRQDGTRVMFSTTGSPVLRHDPVSDQDEVIGAVIVCRDVTSRHQLEQRTQIALDTLLIMARSLIAEQVTEEREAPTSEHDVTNRAHANITSPLAHEPTEATALHLVELGCRMLGCTRGSLSAYDPSGQGALPLAAVGLPPGEAERWRAMMRQVRPEQYLTGEESARLRAGIPVVTAYRSAKAKGQPTFGAESVLLVPLMAGGALMGILSMGHGARPHHFTTREITLAQGVANLCALVLERHRLLHEQAAAEARALASEETKRQMDALFALASHELRTPLTVVKTSTEVAQRRANRLEKALQATKETPEAVDAAHTELESVRQLLDRALKAANRQERLVADLLDVSRLHLGSFTLQVEDCDLAALARETVDELRLTSPGRDLRFSLPLAPALVRADAGRVGQVLANYMMNACKFSPEGSPVEVAVEVRGDVARVSVRDEGTGIAPDDQPHVWDQFYQVPNANWSGGSQVGLGLGLYLSREIISRLGGQVGAESAIGAGSTFWFTLPLAQPLA